MWSYRPGDRQRTFPKYQTHYPVAILYISIFILFVANTINIGADLGAMASAGQLLLPLPFLIWLITVTLISVLLQIFLPYASYSKYLKYLAFSLLAYILTAFVVKQDWEKALYATIVPSFSFNKDYFMNIVAILGTTISPYLFFWQASEEVESLVKKAKLKEMAVGTPQIKPKDIKDMRLDTIAGMLLSQIVMFFIIVTTASTLGTHGIHKVDTAAQAAQALRPIAGDAAFLLFAIGIIGTGLLAVPILAGSASYAISETFGWQEGLYKPIGQAWGFYGIIIIATILGFFVNFMGIPPFRMLYYTAILNGICAPPLMVLILLISNNKDIMAEHTNSLWSNIVGWIITALMGIAALALLVTLGQSS